MTSTIVAADTNTLRFDGDTSTRSGAVFNAENLMSKGNAIYGPWKYGKCTDASLNNDEPGCVLTKKTWNGTHCNPRKIDGTAIPTTKDLCIKTAINIWTPSKFIVDYGVPFHWWSGMYDGKRWQRKSSNGALSLRASRTAGPNGKTGVQADVPVRVTTMELRGIVVHTIPEGNQYQNCTLELKISEIKNVLSVTEHEISICIYDKNIQTHPADADAYDAYIAVENLIESGLDASLASINVEIAVHRIFVKTHSRPPNEHGMRIRVILHSSSTYDEYTEVSIQDISLGITEPERLLKEGDASAVTMETWVRHTANTDSQGATTKWHKFWWWTPGNEWPSSENDVLGHEYGYCKESDMHCFQRLPEGLEEEYTELMAEDHAGNTRLVWRFDGEHSIAHAAWRALR